MQDGEFFTVERVKREASDVISLRLAPEAAGVLPDWAPGAHIDLLLPSGLIRQYSLCGDRNEKGFYRIAVLAERNGRGGSREVHDIAQPGVRLAVRGPRNNFHLEEADDYLFIAGGIGITPIMAMVREVARMGKPWRLVYGGRSRDSMAFLQELAEIEGGEVAVIPEDEVGRPALAAVVLHCDPKTLIYCCGPEGLINATTRSCRDAGLDDNLRIERFGVSEELAAQAERPRQAFEVELKSTGEVLPVPADRSLLDVLLDVRPRLPYGCRLGYCGVCETRLAEGAADHRDVVLSNAERAANETLMVCVSRACGDRLVLDI